MRHALLTVHTKLVFSKKGNGLQPSKTIKAVECIIMIKMKKNHHMSETHKSSFIQSVNNTIFSLSLWTARSGSHITVLYSLNTWTWISHNPFSRHYIYVILICFSNYNFNKHNRCLDYAPRQPSFLYIYAGTQVRGRWPDEWRTYKEQDFDFRDIAFWVPCVVRFQQQKQVIVLWSGCDFYFFGLLSLLLLHFFLSQQAAVFQIRNSNKPIVHYLLSITDCIQ